jgi:hypothetical protein
MQDATRHFTAFGKRRFAVVERLPDEHGFWIMLGAAQASALLRTGGGSLSVVVAVSVVGAAILAASSNHRRIRKSSAAQLAASAALALSSVPVEIAGALPLSTVASAGLSRSAVFVASALVVRATFAGAARGGQRRSLLLSGVSLTIPALSAALLFALGWIMEAGTCVIAGAVCAVFAWSRPTVKQLKPLGLALAGLTVVTVATLAQ